MEASGPLQQPDWVPKYLMHAGNFSTIDQGTLEFLSKTFNCLPVVLVPVDYSAPFPTARDLALLVPPPPLPEARAHQAPGLAEPAVGLQELEGALNGRAGSQEAELCELSQWFNSLSSSAKQEALASVAKTLYFPTDPSQHPPVPTLAQQLAAVAPPPSLAPPAHTGLTVYADAGLLAPAAAPAAAPTSVAAARPAPLADRTNLQGVSRAAHLKELSSKLHVAHSQKVAVPLPPEDVKALLDYQLHASEPTRAPWWRDNQPRGGVPVKRGAIGEGGLKPAGAAPNQVVLEPTVGTGAFVPHQVWART